MHKPEHERIWRSAALAAAVLALGAIIYVWQFQPQARQVMLASGNAGDPAHGREIIIEVGCGACHLIPDIPAARGQIGPPLTDVRSRTMIAGYLPNSMNNLVRWIEAPTEVVPGTGMPDLQLSADQARDVAAYLHSRSPR